MNQTQDLPEIEWHEAVVSTNELALKVARNKAVHGTTIAARTQTKGRGRGQRDWASPAGGLYLSLVVRPRLEAEQWGLLPLATGLGAAAASERLVREAGLVAKVGLKWPNDLVLHKLKLGGILCQGTPGEFGVLGLGVNLNTDPVALPAEVRDLATRLPGESGHRYPLERAAYMMRDSILGSILLFERGAEQAIQAYSERCQTLGQNVRWAGGEGQAIAINDNGSLMVETASGQQELTEEVHLG